MDKIKVIITNKQKDVKIPTGLRMLIRRCCNAVLRMEEFEGSVEVSVTIVNNQQIKELNAQYRDKDMETDVLSFPMGENGKYDIDPTTDSKILGDIVISIEKQLNRLIDMDIAFSVRLVILQLTLCFIFLAMTTRITGFSVCV